MQEMLRELDKKVTATLEHLETELVGIRANRAQASLVADIKVLVYDTKMTLVQLASITTPEPDLILIQPWDKTIIKEIEKAINNSGKGISAQIDADVVRIKLPALSQDRRLELAKLARAKGEEANISLRNNRHEAQEALKALALSEDDEKLGKKQIDDQIQQATQQVKERVERKEADILTL